jgi:hypothetical protein
MKGIIARSLGLAVSLAALSTTLLAGPAAKQPEKPQSATPLPTDWSHQHLIFSHPRTPEQAVRVQKDIRYQLQQRRLTARTLGSRPVEEDAILESRFREHHKRRYGHHRMHRDWSWDLGSGGTLGAGGYPAKFSFSSTVATCGIVTPPAIPDYTVFGTGLAGTTIQGSIIALTNLYKGCSGPTPGSYWSYNTGGKVNTSPVLSLDGTQVAFVQTNGTLSVLVLLKWTPFDGQVQNPATDLQSVLPGAYLTCSPLPCMTTFALGANDTNSSVYYDYGNDTAWVGDDSGKLHQYTGVFLGTPTEVTTGGWPAAVGGVLTSPVHDDGSGNTFVANASGFVSSVSSGGVVTTSAKLDSGTGFTEGPIIDSSAGMVYAFSSNDGGTPSPSAAVFQLTTSFAGGATGTEAKIGAPTAGTTPQYKGAFDHTYINAATPTGNMYVCGNPGGNPTLYQIPISANVMGTPLVEAIVSSTGGTTCSPVTDVYNATITGAGLPQEWAFLSVQGAGLPTACGSHSCVMNFKVTEWQPLFNYNTGQEVLDSHGDIEVVDDSGGGISGGTAPAWSTGIYAPTMDGSVKWRNQGPLVSLPPNAFWAAGTYTGVTEIIDSNNNIEITQVGGTSGGAAPTWATGYGDTTTDGTITWTNFGANPVAGLPEDGGSSGIIMDNTIVNPGGSQVYFSTLQDASCGGNGLSGGGTGGCAVQASQPDLN